MRAVVVCVGDVAAAWVCQAFEFSAEGLQLMQTGDHCEVQRTHTHTTTETQQHTTMAAATHGTRTLRCNSWQLGLV